MLELGRQLLIKLATLRDINRSTFFLIIAKKLVLRQRKSGVDSKFSNIHDVLSYASENRKNLNIGSFNNQISTARTFSYSTYISIEDKLGQLRYGKGDDKLTHFDELDDSALRRTAMFQSKLVYQPSDFVSSCVACRFLKICRETFSSLNWLHRAASTEFLVRYETHSN